MEVCYTESGRGSGSGPKYKAAKRDIIRTIIPIDMSSHHDGRYPFQFRIPDQLPSSMYHKDGNGGYCAVRYKVKMHLRHGLDQEIPIDIISKPPSSVPHPSSADPMLSRIQFMYCIPQGSVTWAAGVDNTRIGVGEDLQINLGIKNESLAKLERVTAKLKQNVQWQSPSHHSINKSIVRSTSFARTDSMLEWNKDQLRVKKHCTKGSLAAQPLTVYEEVLETLQEGNNRVTIPIPEYICQSYTGRLIKIDHYISITAKTPSCFTSPKIHIPIEIVSPGDTPVVVAAHAIPIEYTPAPSAPPFDFGASTTDADMPTLSSTLMVAASPVSNENKQEEDEEEEIMVGINVQSVSDITAYDGYASSSSESLLPLMMIGL